MGGYTVHGYKVCKYKVYVGMVRVNVKHIQRRVR